MIFENNNVVVSGEVMGNFEFSHEMYGEGFYTSTVASRRLSGVDDFVPITVSEKLVDVNQEWAGQRVKILGAFRSYNKHDSDKNRLILSVFAQEFELYDSAMEDENAIFLSGYICKDTIYRKTPLGREIADILLAVNRPYYKSDYIPCICWGGNAMYVNRLSIGDKCEIYGRIQSREYMKRISENECEKRLAYEVSASRVEEIWEGE